MTKTLILAEKPSVAKDIAKVLRVSRNNNGYMESDKYIVTWALGHLVTLATPEEYKSEYANWKIEDLPIIPNKMKLSIIKQTRKQYNTVVGLMKKTDVTDIIIATDAGREGELVARWIIEMAAIKKPIKRLWISSVTDKAIKEGFNKLRDGRAYENLYYSARARAEADWVVGINATRALTVKHNTPLSCGRVQTPTVNMVKFREEEIARFIPKTYYGIVAKSNNIDFNFIDSKNNGRFFNLDFVEKVKATVKDGNVEIISIDSKTKKTYAQNLYDLTTLQRDANAKYGFSAKETLNIAQNLYERHKVLTYPRTDSSYLTADIVPTIRERLQGMNTGSFKDLVKDLLKKSYTSKMKFVNDNKVGDHHAIIPTEEPLRINELSDKEFKIYNLVARRFIENLMDPYIYEEKIIRANGSQYTFETRGIKTLEEGFRKLYKSNEYSELEIQGDREMPDLKVGQRLKISQVNITKGQTKSPDYFTEGTLLMAMESPFKYINIENSKYKNILGKTGGIGTVATRADIIEKLLNTDLLEKKDQRIKTTSKGRQLLELVPEDIKSPELTAKWEENLVAIEKGTLKEEAFLKEIREFSKNSIKEIKKSEYKFRHDNMTKQKCPECTSFLLKVNRKDKEMLVCSNRECSYKRTLSQTTNTRCPNCFKRLQLIGDGDKKSFICQCGHRESYEAFTRRKDKEKSSMKKGEVKQFLQKQDNKEEVVNTKLADALKNLKF